MIKIIKKWKARRKIKTKLMATNVVERHLGTTGRLISGSKSLYRRAYPDNITIFNANIVTKRFGKIWYGDVDITIDIDRLKNIAIKLGETIYVLGELDGRFRNENKPKIENAIFTTDGYESHINKGV